MTGHGTAGPGAVFLSYASEDAAPADRICTALRAAGIEVWFDRSELRGGDAWDAAIRQQIKSCALFVPVISAATHARREGYFRLEWKLGIDRSHLMSSDTPFLVPVAIDATPQSDERIPERFREVQWTRLPGGETSPAFVTRVARLLDPTDDVQRSASRDLLPGAANPATRPAGTLPWWVASALAALGIGYWIWQRQPASPAHAEATAAAPAAFAAAPDKAPGAGQFSPPPHSVAVLPFVNMSGDKAQDYFSDGLSEELQNSLSRINDLQVAARTSSFSFKGKDVQIGTVGRELNVAAVLEGSVRRSGSTVRITAQLVNAVSGFQLWSDTYDRNLGDVLKLQTEIANAVAGALKVTLLGNEAAKIELGGTHNPGALDAYLKGLRATNSIHDDKGSQAAIAAFSEAIKLDPDYAMAYAYRSFAYAGYAQQYAPGGAEQARAFDRALADARHALELAPDLAVGHAALAQSLEDQNEFRKAGPEYQRAIELAPNDVSVLSRYAIYALQMGNTQAGVAAGHRGVVLDPLNAASYRRLGDVLQYAGDQKQSIAAYDQAIAMDPEAPQSYARRGLSYYLLQQYEDARSSCEAKPGDWERQGCLAVTYQKLGRRADAQAQLDAMMAEQGDSAAYQYAEIYAQWGESAKALDALALAVKLKDPGLQFVTIDPLLQPLYSEARFHAMVNALQLPE